MKIETTTTQHNYLGLLVTEYLDINALATDVAESGSTSLGILIAETKAFGGIPFNSFKKLYDCMVWSTLNDGAAIWGISDISYRIVQNREIRYFLG